MDNAHYENLIRSHNISLGRAVTAGDFQSAATIAKDIVACAAKIQHKKQYLLNLTDRELDTLYKTLLAYESKFECTVAADTCFRIRKMLDDQEESNPLRRNNIV